MKVSAKNNFVLAKDGKWASFPQVPGLLRYEPSEVYYGRIKINGKIKKRSLETKSWREALIKLNSFKIDQRKKADLIATPDFTEALKDFEKALEANQGMKPRSKEYRRLCIRKIKSTWPALWELKISEISDYDCQKWAADLAEELAPQYFNNVAGTLSLILQKGCDAYYKNTRKNLHNPAKSISKAKIIQKHLQLPEPDQFHQLVKNIRQKSGSWGRPIGDYVEFLAYSGMRAFTEAQNCHWEHIDWNKKEILVLGDPNTGTKNHEIRRIPILPNMETLLNHMKQRRPNANGKILEVEECYKALKRACGELGIPKMRIHDLRHLFATRCIESGVDIPTVAKWLGHKDGGALAMRTYGHLRNEHSQKMAKKVKF